MHMQWREVYFVWVSQVQFCGLVNLEAAHCLVNGTIYSVVCTQQVDQAGSLAQEQTKIRGLRKGMVLLQQRYIGL